MGKQYHYVVMYDDSSGRFEIDWDSTLERLENDRGTIWDTVAYEWESWNVRRADYDDMGDVLAGALKAYSDLRMGVE
jgi:hypothetical protein